MCTETPSSRVCAGRDRTGGGSTRCGRSGRPRSSCSPCATGWRRTRSRMWRWRARACTGSPCSTCSRRPSRVCWSTPPTSSRSRAGRPTSRTVCGSRNAGIKLASVATNILGVSGRAMLAALVHGTTDPAVLADLARGKLRKKLPALRQALAGRFRPHHAFLVSQLLAHLDYLDEAIATVSEEVEGRLAPFAAQLTQLDTIPGINNRTAEVIIAELGVDMSSFPSDRHLASWAGICPGNNESAGKHKSGKTRKGNRWLRMTLIEAAAAATRTKDSALQARYRRVMRHRGHKKAVVAVAHAMLRAVYHLLAEGTTYREQGADYSDRHHTHRVTPRDPIARTPGLPRGSRTGCLNVCRNVSP